MFVKVSARFFGKSVRKIAKKCLFYIKFRYSQRYTFTDILEEILDARVSTNEQSLDRQLEAFHQLGAEEKYIFADKQSGKNLERTNYQILRNNILRSGDTLVIKSLDRLSRNKIDIKSELEYYKQNGIRVKVIDMPTTMIDLEGQEWIIEMVNNIIIEVLSSVAEQERQETRKRQAEGIAAARKRGQHLGRQEKNFPPNWFEVYIRWKKKESELIQLWKS